MLDPVNGGNISSYVQCSDCILNKITDAPLIAPWESDRSGYTTGMINRHRHILQISHSVVSYKSEDSNHNNNNFACLQTIQTCHLLILKHFYKESKPDWQVTQYLFLYRSYEKHLQPSLSSEQTSTASSFQVTSAVMWKHIERQWEVIKW